MINVLVLNESSVHLDVRLDAGFAVLFVKYLKFNLKRPDDGHWRVDSFEKLPVNNGQKRVNRKIHELDLDHEIQAAIGKSSSVQD